MSEDRAEPATRMVPVIFACWACGQAYSANQGLSPRPASGQFDCTGCGTKIFQWSEQWDYTGWQRYTGTKRLVQKNIRRKSSIRRKIKCCKIKRH